MLIFKIGMKRAESLIEALRLTDDRLPLMMLISWREPLDVRSRLNPWLQTIFVLEVTTKDLVGAGFESLTQKSLCSLVAPLSKPPVLLQSPQWLPTMKIWNVELPYTSSNLLSYS